jgi:surfactin synthase thioesterase subunit
MDTIKMICLPFAGGSKYSYYRYVKLAPPWLQIIPIDLPGRGARLNEPLLTDMHLIVEDVLNRIRQHLDAPYVFYGHSMGALTTLLLTRKIREVGLRLPMHLFVTGHGGPAANDNKIIRHNLPEKELIDELAMLDGIPGEVMTDETLLGFFLPIIRADFKAIETFSYTAEDKFDIPITCVIGREELITIDRARAWERETTAPVEIRQFPGKHFFIYQYEREIINLVGKKIMAGADMRTQHAVSVGAG